MSVEVKLDAEEISEMVTTSIVNSILGEKIKEQIQKQVDRLLRGDAFSSETIIERLVRDVVYEEIGNIIKTPRIRKAVAAKVREYTTDDVLKEIIDNAWELLRSKR